MSCLLRSWHNFHVPSGSDNIWFKVNAYDYVKQKDKQKEHIHQEIEEEGTCSDYSRFFSLSVCVNVIQSYTTMTGIDIITMLYHNVRIASTLGKVRISHWTGRSFIYFVGNHMVLLFFGVLKGSFV